jgi:uncharacterized protein DUF4430
MVRLTTVSPSAWNVSVGGFLFSRLKQHIPVFAPLGAGLLIITLITALGGLWQYQGELDGKLAAEPLAPVSQLAASHQNVPSGAAGSDKAGVSQNQTGGATSRNVVGSSGPAQSGRTGSTGPAATSYGQPGTPANPQTVISVSLSVNGHAKGVVRLASGGSQCDVLSQALAEGVISSLDMRYSQSYGTEGVYVIDGQGDHDVVWWTYQVNGHAPPYGCGYTTAHDGDSANWQYVKT